MREASVDWGREVLAVGVSVAISREEEEDKQRARKLFLSARLLRFSDSSLSLCSRASSRMWSRISRSKRAR